MSETKRLYPTHVNPFLIRPSRPLPDEMAVIGAGNIGPDIAYYLRTGLPGRKLYLVDVVEDALKRAEKRFQEYAAKSVAKRKITQEEADAILGGIVYTTDYGDLRNCGLVIEAATENLALKKKIFEKLEEIVSPEAILSSNTSSIPAHQIFGSMKSCARMTVTHFFAPAWRSLPVEVVRWAKVDPKVVDQFLWFFAQTGKTPIATDDVYSFVLNRIFENWCNEAAFLLDRATTLQVDSVTEEFVGAGPFFVLNMSGGNPLVHESQTRRTAERAAYAPSPLLHSVEKWKTSKPGTEVETPLDVRDWVRDRMLGVIFSQCFDIADRNIGTRADLNFGSLVGLGFKKGILDVMEELGAEEVSRIVEAHRAERPGFPAPKGGVARYLDFPRDILVDDLDGVRVLTIRRPQAANALGARTCGELLAELKRGADNPAVKGFVITGYGTKAFCAGADIGGFIATFDDHAAGAALARGNSEVLHYIDRMEKPVVAAVNGLAMGGGTEVAIRCHSMVAVKNAFFQLPEITLGILPGMGGAVIPYRKWPQAAATFHEMIGQGRRLTLAEAVEVGMVKGVAQEFDGLIELAVSEVNRLEGNVPRIEDAPVSIPEFPQPENPMAGNLPLSREALSIVAGVVMRGAAAASLEEALEINYLGSGDISCIDAPKEGVGAFLAKRKAVFTK